MALERRKGQAAGRRRRGGGWGARFAKRLADLWQGLLETPALWLVLFLALGAWVLLPRGLLFVPRVEVGAIADRDYVAPEDLLVPDDETTLARQQRAREAVPPVYDLDPKPGVEEGIGVLFAAGRAALAAGSGRHPTAERWLVEQAQALGARSGLRLTAEQAGLFFRRGFPEELEERLRGFAAQVARRGVVLSKDALLENRLRGITLRNLATGAERLSFDLYEHLAYPDGVRDLAESEVRDWPALAAADRRLLVAFLQLNLNPNLHFNKSETVLRQEQGALASPPSLTQVRRGKVIARKGDELGAAEVRLISSFRPSSATPVRAQLLPVLGTLALLGLAALVVWAALDGERVAHHSRRQLFGESLLLLLVSLVGARLAFLVAEALAGAFETSPLTAARSWAYGVPFAALGLLAALLLGRQTAVVLAAIFSLLASRLTGEAGVWVVVYSLAGSLAAIYSLDRYQVKQRLVMSRVGLVVGLVNVVIALMLLALGDGRAGSGLEVGFELLCAAAGGLLVAAVASFATPILEAMLGITTDIKLAELANTNLPLLRRLAFEAPGSFQHSLMVANLAKQACEAIGADAPLAYTAGLYHDVGKVLRPEYFIENQRPDHNPHDRLQPTMSALVLISHIKDGLELARQHHLPQPILDAIEQHHGTRLIKYFYSRAAEQQARLGSEVSEEKFRYPGPRPENRVMGVLMLADAVEAASRTLVDPSAAKLRTLIRTIVEDCLHDGQLDDTDLTLSDLRRISETFLRVLSNIYHQRIDYPGFDFNARPAERKEARLTVVAGARGS